MLLFACSKPATSKQVTKDPDVLANVGAREIRTNDLRAEADRRRTNGQPVPAKAALLEEMVVEESGVQRALALGMDQDPELQRAWRSLLIGTLRNRELDGKLRDVAITPEEVAAEYEARRTQFTLPERARIGVIVVNRPPTAPAAQQAELRQRMDAALALSATEHDGFAKAALQFSEHQGSRYKGGEIGWVQKGQAAHRLPARVIEAAFAMEHPGQVSGVIEETNGFYLVTLLERTMQSVLPIEKVDAKVRAKLTRERRETLAREFDETLRKHVGAHIHPDALEQAELPASPAGESAPPALPRTAHN